MTVTLPRRAAAYIYRRSIRPFLPRRAVNYAGICICHDRHWGDGLLLSAGALLDNPGYEATLIAALRETIRSGDNVVIVGGGVGVTAVVAALRTTGIVHCFEGSKQQAQCVQKT